MATDEEKEHVFQVIEQAVDAIVSEVAKGHYEALTQEPQLTSRIAGAIEHTIKQMDVGDLNVQVEVRDFPAQGRGALEGKVGADVYISVAVIPENREDVSKGMLAQAKWDHSAKDPKLPEQIGKMMERSESSSYVGLRAERRYLLSCWRLYQSRLRRSRWSIGRIADRQWFAMQAG